MQEREKIESFGKNKSLELERSDRRNAFAQPSELYNLHIVFHMPFQKDKSILFHRVQK